MCGRQVVFDLVVQDDAGHAIEGSTIEAACVDVDGPVRHAQARSDFQDGNHVVLTITLPP
jgi:hypothetical protein